MAVSIFRRTYFYKGLAVPKRFRSRLTTMRTSGTSANAAPSGWIVMESPAVADSTPDGPTWPNVRTRSREARSRIRFSEPATVAQPLQLNIENDLHLDCKASAAGYEGRPPVAL